MTHETEFTGHARTDWKVTVAIVTYRSEAELSGCLESVLASDIPVKIVVIDNRSPDSTFKIAESYASKFQNVFAINSGENIGLAAANNLVLPHIEGDYVLILNPDTEISPTAVSSLVRSLEADQSVGVVGPKNIYSDGSPHTSYHRGWSLWHLVLWRILPYSLVRRLYDRFASYKRSRVGFVSGACLLIRANLFRQIGGYDPRYFLTVEDACDLCRRSHDAGFSTLYDPGVQIKHLCGRSGAQVPYLATLEGYKGSIYYFTKFGGRLEGLIAYIIVSVGCFSKLLASALKVLLRRRSIDQQNLNVYLRILPQLMRLGPDICYSKPTPT
jgi:N-acetylglucosaminyl-diphospho-decaprenol L-rhamnosyltransferase